MNNFDKLAQTYVDNCVKHGGPQGMPVEQANQNVRIQNRLFDAGCRVEMSKDGEFSLICCVDDETYCVDIKPTAGLVKYRCYQCDKLTA